MGLGGAISSAKYTYDHSSYAKEVYTGPPITMAYFAKDNLSHEENKARCAAMDESDKQNYLEREEKRIKDADGATWTWAIVGAIANGFFAVGIDLAAYRSEKNKLIARYTSSINDDRHLRLQHRIRQIEEKLNQPENEQEKSLLYIAKDYFRQKLDKMNVERNNKITLVAKYV